MTCRPGIGGKTLLALLKKGRKCERNFRLEKKNGDVEKKKKDFIRIEHNKSLTSEEQEGQEEQGGQEEQEGQREQEEGQEEQEERLVHRFLLKEEAVGSPFHPKARSVAYRMPAAIARSKEEEE